MGLDSVGVAVMGDKPAFATHQSRNGLTQPGWCSSRSLHEHSSAMTFRNRTIKGMAWTMAATIGFASELVRPWDVRDRMGNNPPPP